MTQTQDYENIITAILSRWKRILGGTTVYKHTYDIPGLQVTPLGDFLSINNDGYAVLDEVLKRFEGISGVVATGISYEAAKDYINFSSVKLPEKLKHGVSATESFLKSI